jgi:sensor histidine kinase YesM
MNKLKKIFKSIIEIGLHQNVNQKEVKKIKILNFSSFFMGATLLISLTLKHITSEFSNFLTIIFLIESILYFSVLFFNYSKYYVTARFLFFIYFTSILFLHNNFLFIGEYTEYYYIVIPIGSLLFFESKYVHYSLLIIVLILFYLPNHFLNLYEENNFGFFHVAPFFIGVFIAVQYYRNENLKNESKLKEAYVELEERKKSEYADLKLKSLRAQMNPHFMFNALNSIQDLILKQDTDASYDYIVMFAQLIRDSLNYSNHDFITLEQELNFLKVYLELEKLRIGNDFNYTIDFKEDESIEVPSLLIQPFIENALVHGLIHKKGSKNLKINFNITNNILECTIKDNGIGRKKAKEILNRQGNHHQSFALQAIEKRLEVFYKKYNKNVGYKITDLYENENPIGTKVVLTIPYNARF